MALSPAFVCLVAISGSCYGGPVPEVPGSDTGSTNAPQGPFTEDILQALKRSIDGIDRKERSVTAADRKKRSIDWVVDVCFGHDSNVLLIVEDFVPHVNKTVQLASQYITQNLDSRVSLRLHSKPHDFRFSVDWGFNSYFNSAKGTPRAVITVAEKMFAFPMKGRRYAEILLEKGCDVFFLLVGDYDSLWDQSPGVYGASKTLSVCQKTSFGILRFNKELDYFRNILGHHVGHLLGLYHDGGLVDEYESSSTRWMNDAPELFLAMKNDCTSDSEAEKCIMHEVPAFSCPGEFATCYTNCSKAYFNMFLHLADTMPNTHPTDCLLD